MYILEQTEKLGRENIFSEGLKKTAERVAVVVRGWGREHLLPAVPPWMHLEEPHLWIPSAFLVLVFQTSSISNMLKKTNKF